MSFVIGNKTYTNPNFVRSKIEEVTQSTGQTQGMVDYVELMADGYLALDQSPTDENKKKNQVTFISDGLYIHAERDKKGDIKAFEMIDERGDEPKEIKKTLNEGRPSYQISLAGQAAVISEDANGTLVFDVG